MKHCHLLSSLSFIALTVGIGAVSSPAFAVVPNCSTDGNCLYGVTNNTDTAIARNGYSNPVLFGGDGTLNVGHGVDIWYFYPANVNADYDYIWDQTSGNWVASTGTPSVSVGRNDAFLTVANNTGTVNFQGNSFVYGNIGTSGSALKQVNGGANGALVEFNDGVYRIQNVNFTGNGEMRFGLWDRCSLGPSNDRCNLVAGTVTTQNNGQGVLSFYGSGVEIGSIGTSAFALAETHAHGSARLGGDSYMGRLMYGGTVDVSGATASTVNLGFTSLVTGSGLEVANINATGKTLNLVNGFSVAFSNANALNALQSLWGRASVANPAIAAADLAVKLVAGTNNGGGGPYLTYGNLSIRGNAVAPSPLDKIYVSDGTSTPATQTDIVLHADSARVTSTVGNWAFLLGEASATSADLLFQRTSTTPHRDILASGNVNSNVFAGLANALDGAANAYYANPLIGYSAGFESTLGKLDMMSVGERTQAMQQMADMSVNNSVTTSINGVGMQVSQAIAAHSADALDVNLGINAGDETLGSRNNVWVQAIGSWNDQNRRNGVDGYRADTYGTALGFDRMIQDGTSLGIALHYANTRVDGKGVFSGNNTKINSYGLTLYGQQSLTPELVLDGRLGYAYHDVRANRYSSALGERASGSWGGNQFDAAAKLGYTVALPQNVAVTPSLGMAYTYLHEGAYTESGDGMALKVGSRATNALLIGGGVKGSKVFTTEGKTTITPEIHGGVYYDALASSMDTTAQFVGGGSSFITRNVKPDPWVFNVGAGVKVATTDNLAISVNYDAALRDQFVGHTASLKAKMTF